MNVYKITYSVTREKDFLAENKAVAISYASGECPYQALFYARNSLENTSWVTQHDENIVLIDKNHHEYKRRVVNDARIKNQAITIINTHPFHDINKTLMIA